MPAWMTPLLCVLVSRPARGCRSTTQTDRPRSATASAEARPVTPAPITATSICSITPPGGSGESGSSGRRGDYSWPAYHTYQTYQTSRSAPIPNRRVVEMREQQAVEDRGVGVDCVRDADHRARRRIGSSQRFSREMDRLHLRVLRHRRAVADRHTLETARLQQILKCIGMDRPHVREVPEVAAEKG